MARANPRVNDLTTQVSRRWIGAGALDCGSNGFDWWA